MIGTKYACNHDNSGIDWNRLQAYIVRFGFEIASIFGSLYYRDCKHIRSSLFSWLQAYQVRFKTEIASILGPSHNLHCKHIWSLSQKLLQPYLVHPYIFLKTSISFSNVQKSATWKYFFWKSSCMIYRFGLEMTKTKNHWNLSRRLADFPWRLRSAESS